MSLYTKHIPTTIFGIPLLFLAYEPLKVYKNNMDNPVMKAFFNRALAEKTYDSFPMTFHCGIFRVLDV